jgi:diguanylate cyclase (GGDEF)-like protein
MPTQTSACLNGQSDCPCCEEVLKLRKELKALGELVRTDFLTSLFNKQHLSFSLEQELERTRRCKQATTLFLIDADHFKTINDTHGHIVGDKVLQHLAYLIKENTRRIDIPCRYGGEEFAVVLPATPLLTGVHVAERLREEIQNSRITLESGDEIAITVSIGVASTEQHTDHSPESFLKSADEQLYAAKELGRNQVKFRPLQRDNSATVSAEEKSALFDDPDQ